jgi:hypothetical protein
MSKNLHWMRSSLLALVDVIEFQTVEMYSSLALSEVKYNTYMHSRDEKLKVMLRTRPKNLV